MKTVRRILITGLVWATCIAGLSQTAPKITKQPGNQSVSVGAEVTFSVNVAGDAPLSFQWRYGQVPIAGGTESMLTIPKVQLTNQGLYDVVVTNPVGTATSRAALLEVDGTFTKITTGPVVTTPLRYASVAWGDYDGDGWIDLLVANADGSNFLHRNQGNGEFVEITDSPITSENGSADGPVWGDFDNDGNLDLFASNSPSNPHFLFRGLGEGRFDRILDDGPLVSASGMSGQGFWVDYDSDGYLDVFFHRWYGGEFNRTNSLFHNEGDGSFREVPAPGQPLTGYNSQAAWADFDNDGRPDLVFVSYGKNKVYHNEGGGQFTSLTNAISRSMDNILSLAWADYDNDGYLDLLATCLGNGGAPNVLFRNLGEAGGFAKTALGLGPANYSIDGAWGDYDNDGYLDLFIAQGNGQGTSKNLLYHNNGDGKFTLVTKGSLVNELGDYSSCAWADYGNDGFLDLVYAGPPRTLTRSPSPDNHACLYHNNGNSNKWIIVRLVGTASNRSAIGAKVRVKATLSGKTFWQLREVSSGNGHAQGDLRAHFGLGNATAAEIIRVEWPSGVVQELTNVKAGQILTIAEPPSLQIRPGTNPGTLEFKWVGQPGAAFDLLSSRDLVNWTPWMVLTNSSRVTVLEQIAAHGDWRFFKTRTR